jgi:hypothetical protein
MRAPLSSYNYNALLDSRSQQNVNGGFRLHVLGNYGGCATNYFEGIEGRERLIDEKKRSIQDQGFLPCELKGTIAYSPYNIPTNKVMVTITSTGNFTATPSGWTSIGGNQYTREYTGNTREILIVEDENGTGMIPLEITWIADAIASTDRSFITSWKTTYSNERITI